METLRAAGRRAGCSHPLPPAMPPHTHPFHVIGLVWLGRAEAPSPTGTLRWPAASVSPPAQDVCVHSTKTGHFPREQRNPLAHCGGLDGQGSPGAPARPSSPSQLCRPGPGLPELSPGPGLWRAQVSAPVITRKVELAPLPRRDGWGDTALIMGEIWRLRGQ